MGVYKDTASCGTCSQLDVAGPMDSGFRMKILLSFVAVATIISGSAVTVTAHHHPAHRTLSSSESHYSRSPGQDLSVPNAPEERQDLIEPSVPSGSRGASFATVNQLKDDQRNSQSSVLPTNLQNQSLTGDGMTSHSETTLKKLGSSQRTVAVQKGTISWVSPEGIPFTLSYVADETGFHPVGSHLPTPPAPLPPQSSTPNDGATIAQRESVQKKRQSVRKRIRRPSTQELRVEGSQISALNLPADSTTESSSLPLEASTFAAILRPSSSPSAAPSMSSLAEESTTLVPILIPSRFPSLQQQSTSQAALPLNPTPTPSVTVPILRPPFKAQPSAAGTAKISVSASSKAPKGSPKLRVQVISDGQSLPTKWN